MTQQLSPSEQQRRVLENRLFGLLNHERARSAGHSARLAVVSGLDAASPTHEHWERIFDKEEADLAAIRAEIAAIRTELGEASAMVISQGAPFLLQ